MATPINLIVSIHADRSPERDREILSCLATNASLESMSRVLAVEEPPHRLRSAGKVRVLRVEQRPTIARLLEEAREHSGEEDVNIIANSDIYFEEGGLRTMARHLRKHECLALSRWDVLPGGATARPLHSAKSQDAWVFRGPPRDVNAPFSLGRDSCDNRLAYELAAAGYSLMNPCRTIRIFHLHTSGVRYYTPLSGIDEIPGPYRDVDPCELKRPLAWWLIRKMAVAVGWRMRLCQRPCATGRCPTPANPDPALLTGADQEVANPASARHA